MDLEILLEKIAERELIKEALTPREVSLAARRLKGLSPARIKRALKGRFGHVEASQIMKRIREMTGKLVGLRKSERGAFARALRRRFS